MNLKGIGIILLIVFLGVQIASATPVLPATFYGTVKVNNIDAPVGTIITANMSSPTAVNGSIITTEAGKYGGPGGFDPKLEVQGDSTDVGNVITFWIKRPADSSFIQAGQTSTFDSKTEELNLTANISGLTPSITSWGNNKTNNNATNITVNESETIRFNATANLSITTWNWYLNDVNLSNNFDNFSNHFTLKGNYTVKVNASNANGTSNTITWNIEARDITAPVITIASPINKTYITSTIPLIFSANEAVSTWWYSLNSGTNVTFVPNTTIAASEGANTLVVYANDTSGNTGSASVNFNVDTAPPTVISTSPASGATNVPVTATITANFSEAMDQTTLTTATMLVDGVSGTVTKTSTSMTFTPGASLNQNTKYNVTVTTGVKDLAGNSMASNYTWNFTTVSDTTPPVITNVANSTPTYNSVIITWNTDEASDSLVKYGTSSGVYTFNESNASLVTAHSISLSVLPNTTYYYVVNSTDASGNPNQSSEKSFITQQADIVINEFVSNNATEWVELYNKGSFSINLSGWTLKDEGQAPKSLSGTVTAGGYIVFYYSSGWLNNGGDTIYLNYSTANIDKVGYGTSGGAPAPASGNSAGRYPNGVDTDNDTADFIEFSVPTPGAANVLPAVPAIVSWSNNKTNNNATNITVNVSETVRFNATANQSITTWNWYLNNVNQSNNFNNFSNHFASAGTYTVKVNATNANGTSNTITWSINAQAPPAPGVTGSAPSSPVSDIVGAARTFNITINQTVNVTWYINGSSVQTNTSVTDASYTNGSAALGTWNVSAVASNANGTDMRTWEWNVITTDIIPPVVTNPSASPATILNDNGRARAPGTNITTINVTVTDNVAVGTVTINLSSIGGSANAVMTNISGNVYSITTNATAGINLTNNLVVNATDTSGNFNNSVSVQLTVLRRGDVVRSNTVTGADALFIKRFVVGLETMTPQQLFVADVTPANSSGTVTGADALYIKRYAVGLEAEP